ncbi:MAG: co-chaperone GroES [Patescibacteria group bacterium]
MKLQPLSNHVLIELEESDEKKTKSGIVLPDSVEKKEQTKGTVVSIGPGKLSEKGERLPMSVKIGDRVLFNKPWSEDKKIEEDKKKFYLVDEDEILAIMGDGKSEAENAADYLRNLPEKKWENPAI